METDQKGVWLEGIIVELKENSTQLLTAITFNIYYVTFQ